LSDTGAHSGQPGGVELGIPGIDNVTEIGRSAAATTYRVRDVASGRMVVVKVLNVPSLSPVGTQRFDREQRAMEGLNEHPNLVAVYGHGYTASGRPYVVTEEITGGSIANRLKGGSPMTGPDILELGVRIAGALESAHRVGVAHGDLRAEDMMLSAIGEPMLADFGVVTASGITPDRSDDPQRLAHVAPEVLEGRGVSPASDLYSLASILFALLAGEPAFVSAHEQTVIPVIKRIASNPVPDLRQKGVPDPVADAVEKGMAKEPSQRPASAREFGRVLQQAQVALGLPMTEMTVFTPAGAPPAPAYTPPGPPGPQPQAYAQTAPAPPLGPPPQPGPVGGPPGPPSGPPPAKKKSSTPLIVGVAAIVVLLLGGALFIAFSGGNGGDDDDNGGDETTTTEEEAGVELDDIADDTGFLAAEAPEDWDDVDGAPLGDGTPNVQAAPDRGDFLGSYDTAGIDFTGFTSDQFVDLFDPSDESSLETALEAIAGSGADTRGDTIEAACDSPDREEFDENGLTGIFDLYTDCGDEGTDLVALVGGNDNAGVIVVMILADDDERAVLDDILASLEVTA
jgi:hypothetical protein